MPEPKPDDTTFEEDLALLEKALQRLEGGRLDLDGALAQFESGIALTRRLRTRLDAAEGRIDELLATGAVRELDVE